MDALQIDAQPARAWGGEPLLPPPLVPAEQRGWSVDEHGQHVLLIEPPRHGRGMLRNVTTFVVEHEPGARLPEAGTRGGSVTSTAV